MFMGKAMYVIKSSLDGTDAAAVYGCFCLRLPSLPSLLFSFLFFFSVSFGRPVASYFFSLVFLSLQLFLPSFYLSPLGDLGIGLV